MKKSFSFSVLALIAYIACSIATTSCTDYQDEIDALKRRVDTLYIIIDRTNDNVDAIQTILEASSNNWVITGIVQVDPEQDPAGIGYSVISFGKIDPKTGKLSDKSDDKKVITLHNGKDGADATAPDIAPRQDPSDGQWYWTIDGDWLTDDGTPTGTRIPVTGKDGQDGISTAPILDVNENGEWVISYNGPNGPWVVVRDSNGNPVKVKGQDGTNGTNGTNGTDAFAFITKAVIYIESGKEYVVFTLYDGTEVKLPKAPKA